METIEHPICPTVKVVDSLMGAGKTTAIFKFINENLKKRYLFVTPYLKELERIQENCPTADFIAPDDTSFETKGVHLKLLLEKGHNICISHELLRRVDSSMCRLVSEQNYTLILDEELKVIEMVKTSQKDFMTMEEKYISIDDNGLVHWLDKDYTGLFEEYMKKIRLGTITSPQKGCFMWMFPPDVFKGFNEIFILTYLFRGNYLWAYLELHGIPYEFHHVEKDIFVKGYLPGSTEHFTSLIHLYDGPLNNIERNSVVPRRLKKKDTWFSKKWYLAVAKPKDFKTLKKNMYSYYRRLCCESYIPAEYRMWSIHKDFKKKVQADGCATSFVPCNIRATNEYITRYALVYFLNVYPNPIIKGYFGKAGITIDSDVFALSQLVQWIWRSRIRKGEEIYLYLPSCRMRGLLTSWLNEK